MTLHLQNTITQSQYDHYIIIFSYTHIWVSSSYLPMHCFIRRCWRYGDDYASATFGFKRIRSIQITHNYTQHSRCVRCTTLQAVAMADSEMSLPILWSLGSLLALDLIVRSASVQNKPHSQIVWTKYTNSIILFLSLSFSLSITSSSISFFSHWLPFLLLPLPPLLMPLMLLLHLISHSNWWEMVPLLLPHYFCAQLDQKFTALLHFFFQPFHSSHNK